VVDDVLKVVVGFLLGGPADDADGRPHLDVVSVLPSESLGLGDARGADLGRVDRVECMSECRIANARPVPELPAFIISGARSPYGRGEPSTLPSV
jgi:hypothetical protein